MTRRGFLKGLGTAGLGVGATLTGGCHYYYIVKGELMQTNEMFVEPFRRKSFLTWNINAGRGLDGVRDLARIAAVVKKADVAVTALQEIDRKTVRADGEDQFTALETLTEAQSALDALGFVRQEYTQVSVSKTESLGRYHLMKAQNPVFIIAADGPGEG